MAVLGWLIIGLFASAAPSAVAAAVYQQVPTSGAVITGRVIDAATGEPLSGTLVSVEGTALQVVSDATGNYRIPQVPPGPQVLRAERLGYATARISIVAVAGQALEREISMASSALELGGILVTADPTGRGRGELGTATVIDREAIRHQTAAGLAGVLELVPGVVLQPPGLGGVQQFGLRSVPTSSLGPGAVGPSAGDLASAGTLIVLDGVPLSNNANLQSLGPRGEVSLPTSAGGGVDLRRIPASMIERVEVIRGVPSARYGDLTQGAVIVDTRAGAITPELAFRKDRHTTEASSLAGRSLGETQVFTGLLNVARTGLNPGRGWDEAYRVAGQLSHRFTTRGLDSTAGGGGLTLDTRIDVFRFVQDNPEDPEIAPGRETMVRDAGVRITERLLLDRGSAGRLEVAMGLDRQWQRSFTRTPVTRVALPVTTALEEGRNIGRFIDGSQPAEIHLDGAPSLFFTRAEAGREARWLGFDHSLRAGVELRREWNAGAGYSFDLELPPQASYSPVEGFDRPRRFGDIAALATSGIYLDDRMVRSWGGGHLMVQAGVRTDLLHDGGHWLSGARDAVLQPRLSVELAPRYWIRLRAGAGRTAKHPTVSQLSPAPQYHDMVNVNWYADDPEERLAVITTFILDPTNPELRPAVTDMGEAGFELGFGHTGGALAVTAFRDRVRGAIGFDREPRLLLRDRYELADSTLGTGRPPQIIEPAAGSDPVPVILLRPTNAMEMETSGIEATLSLPEIPWLKTRVEMHGALVRTRLASTAIEVGSGFGTFQLDERIPRAPWWDGSTRTGERALVTWRLVHHQPAAGLVVTATVQQYVRELVQNVAATDSLSFAGYITREAELVRVPASERENAEYVDLRQPRRSINTAENRAAGDWLMSIQVSKTLPLEGRLSFYAFNALDRVGKYSRPGLGPRLHPPIRFGLEVSMAPAAIFR